MLDIIRIPFGYLLDWLCQFCAGSYGLALILFSLILKLVLLPFSIKSKKSMLKMSRLGPQLKALEIECGEDKQKYSQEMSKLYKQEGISPFGGCLWSFLPLLILLPLYHVIREPITYMMHFAKEEAELIVKSAIELGAVVNDKNAFYQQLEIIGFLTENKEAIAAQLPELAEKILAIKNINFTFLGLNLGQMPQWKFWTFGKDAAKWGMLALPVLSAGSQWLSMFISQKMNNKVATNSDGEQDQAAAASANQSGKMMTMMMPLMSLYFCFVMPAAISIYWVAQAVFGTVQDVALTLSFRKVYEAEDALRREEAAARREKELERERLRAERREKYGEEGLLDPNTSKKKLKQQEEQARAAKAEAYENAKNPQPEEAEEREDKHFSGDPERPYCRGRSYKPSRYGRKDEV